MKKKRYISVWSLLFVGIGLLAACSAPTEATDGDTNTINVGGSTVSRATSDASTVDWLKEVLTSTGLSVKYGLRSDYFTFYSTSTTGNATLRYNGTEYTFNDANGDVAKWFDNGYHLFEGVYYPSALLTSNSFNVSDQSASGVYDNLSHYIFIRPDTYFSATVGKITIPYEHRLARVQLNVLIDSDVKNGSQTAAISGYDSSTGGGSTCSLRVKNVKVMTGVSAAGNPTWDTSSSLIPHFLKGTNSITWNGTTYANVPQYEFILRPIYNGNNKNPYYKFYDESTSSPIYAQSFTVSLTLDNGNQYSQECSVALYPNQQITLNIHVAREHVDFNVSTVENWNAVSSSLDYFGTDNGSLSLSDAGGSWQRAYRVGTSGMNVVDGQKYDGTEYLAADNDFIAALKTATVGGEHHGDYFILTGDLTLPSDWTPFEFTGHLDGRGHTIKFADSAAHTLFTNLNGSYTITTTGEANVHLENGTQVPIQGYRAEIMNVTMANASSLLSGDCSGYLFNNTVTSPGTLYSTLDATYGHSVNCHTLTSNP